MNTRMSLVLGIAASFLIGSSGVGLALEKPKVGGAKAGGAAAKDDDSTAVADDGKQFAMNDSGKTVTHDCKGGQAAVNGNKNVLKLVNCAQTSLNGNNNTVDVTGVESLAVMGNDNVVTWHGKKGADEPSVADAGSRNKISGK
jgi:Protein of unknown function (DUF3060)